MRPEWEYLANSPQNPIPLIVDYIAAGGYNLGNGRRPNRAAQELELIVTANGAPQYGDDVALFIDWENFKISLASGSRAPNVTALKEEVSHHGRVVVAKAYADWVTRSPELRGASQFINDPPALYAAGIEPVYVPTRLPVSGLSSNTRTFRVKNSVDVKMTADCIECAHTYPNIGTYVLVSGDSDFIHVINSLRAIGKRVIIIGVSWSTSRRLADQVDGLILYDSDVEPETPPEPVAAPPAAAGRPAARGGVTRQQQLAEVIRVIEDIVRAERQAGRMPLLTSLKQRVMRRIPGFDEKKLGFSGFKKLMLHAADAGNIQLVTHGLVDWVLMADETPPEEERSNDSPVQSVAADEEVVPGAEGETPPAAEETEGGAADDADADAAAAGAAVTAVADFEPPPLAPELEQAMAETLAALDLPAGPGDGRDGRRVMDVVIMADTLEHREGVSHVAFRFLIGQIAGALREGLEAEHPEIVHRWGGGVFSRNYVDGLVRGLRSGGLFLQGSYADRDEETGRARRRRTFNLNHDHPLVQRILESQWHAPAASAGDGDDDPAASDPPPDIPSPDAVDAAADPAADNAANAVDDSAADADAAKEPAPVSAVNRVMRLFRG